MFSFVLRVGYWRASPWTRIYQAKLVLFDGAYGMTRRSMTPIAFPFWCGAWFGHTAGPNGSVNLLDSGTITDEHGSIVDDAVALAQVEIRGRAPTRDIRSLPVEHIGLG